MAKNRQKIAVGVSGGVDSAVTALLLHQAGHEVVGIFMQNWEADREDPFCTAEQDLSDARAICNQIGIPLETANFAPQYWEQVFQYCLDEFASGRTPNPDIWCNREIKFKVFLQHALALGADKLATGHYAQINSAAETFHLQRAIDNNKDQTYFLYTLGQSQLQHCVFPIGTYLKPDVRRLAEQHQLINHAKKDSTGICFIGERKFKDFLKEFLLAQPGDMETPEGKKIGKHDGVMFYTIGQRKGLQIGGRRDSDDEAWYVLAKDVKRNVLIVGQGHDHPLLYASTLICDNVHWVSSSAPITPCNLTAKARYRQIDQPCRLTQLNKNEFKVEFNEPQRALTPGQSIVFYQDQICLGGGTINL